MGISLTLVPSWRETILNWDSLLWLDPGLRIGFSCDPVWPNGLALLILPVNLALGLVLTVLWVP